nr:MAG TPA: hypothetical protein [Bacteriophage sp.]
MKAGRQENEEYQHSVLLLDAVRHHRTNNASQRHTTSDDGFLNSRRHLIAEYASNDQDDAAPGGRLFQPVNEIIHSSTLSFTQP